MGHCANIRRLIQVIRMGKERMSSWLRWSLGLSVGAVVVVVPILHFRATYAHEKRLRIVTPGKFYRSGQLTTEGFRDAIRRYGIRTVINLQDENPDPLLPHDFYRRQSKTLESEVCRQEGARYVMLPFDLPTRLEAPHQHAKVIDEYRKILDDPESYPVLLHCLAGLHRTGLLTAVYRMEYEHWPVAVAVRELRANGFGDTAATSANDYVFAFLEHYRPRWQVDTSSAAQMKKSDGPVAAGRRP